MRIKLFVYVVIALQVLMWGAGCKRVSLQELQQYVKKPEHGLIHTVATATGRYTLMYKPAEQIYFLTYGKESDYSFSRFCEENKNVHFLEFDIQLHKQGNYTIDAFQNEQTRLNFSVNSGLNRGYPLSYHIERTNAKEGIVNLSFEFEPAKDMVITYKDIFNGQDLQFKISASSLKSLPKSRLQ